MANLEKMEMVGDGMVAETVELIQQKRAKQLQMQAESKARSKEREALRQRQKAFNELAASGFSGNIDTDAAQLAVNSGKEHIRRSKYIEKLRTIREVNDIEGVALGETVIYYHGNNLAVARGSKGLDILAYELFRRSFADDMLNTDSSSYVVQFKRGAQGSCEFELKQCKVGDKIYYLAKRVAEVDKKR